MSARSVDVAGTRITVRCHGATDGVPFVFWHGLGHAGNGAFLDVAVPPLVAAGCATYAVNAPGFGGSAGLETGSYSIERLADMLWGTVDALGVSRPIVSGHSWGGSIAVTAAAQRPGDVSALVLFDSGHLDYQDQPGARADATIAELLAELEADPVPDTWAELVATLSEHGLDRDWTLAAWREGFTIEPDGRIQRLATDGALAAASHGLMRARASDGWPAIAAADIPTLVLLATEPPEYREQNVQAGERMRAVVRHADIRPIDGMRHAVFADLGEQAGVIAGEWLREQGIAGIG